MHAARWPQQDRLTSCLIGCNGTAVLEEFLGHYHEARLHQGLDQRVPAGIAPSVLDPGSHRIVRTIGLAVYYTSTAGLVDRVDGGWFTCTGTQRRVIGPAYNPSLDDAYFMSGGSLGGWFDVIIHRGEVTAPSRLD